MTEWPLVRLGDIAADEKSAISKPYGSAIVRDDYRDAGVPMVRGVNLARGRFYDDEFVFISEDLADRMPGARLQPGDLVFTHRGSVGQISMIPRAPRFHRYTLSTSQVKARLDPTRAIPEFFYYWFLSPAGRHSILQSISTVGVPGLARPVETIKSLPVPLPPLDEQRRIAGLLGALDDLIDTDERLATAAAAQAEHAWRQIVRSSTSSAARVGELATVVLGGTPARNRPEFWHGDIPWLNSGKANDFRVIEPSEMITRAGYESSSTKLMPPGTTLIAITGATLGQITRLEFEACGNQSLVGVYSPDRTAMNDHLYFAIRDQLPALVGHATGGAQQHINKGNVESLTVVTPDEISLSRWHAIAKPLLDSVRELLLEAKGLRAARDELLPLLLSGRVRVDEVAA